MISERNTNFVFFSSLLKERPGLKCFWRNLEKTLTGAGINYGFIDNSNDLWCRDYMPVQLGKDEFVQFKFDPSYYQSKKYRHLRTDTAKVQVNKIPPSAVKHSALLLDGGNLIRTSNTVVLTDRILKENKLPEEEVVQHLKQVLKVDNVCCA